ncbi:MAG: hypothetical protein KF893_15045 [Caldilineaceae bacterium]|nr:hypothetical protein [Caldilineaceae bacterium]
MAETFPSDRRDYRGKERKPFRHLALFVILLCTSGLLWGWLSAGWVHSQPSQQISPMETNTPDPFAFPTETSDPFAFPTDTPDPFAFPTDTPDPFVFPTDTPDLFVFPTDTPDPFANEEEPYGEEGESLINLPPVDRPIAAAPASSPDALGVIGGVISSMANVAAWLWFLCGSLIFFVVAGIVGGLLFSQRERHRYDLYQVEPEENPLIEVVEPPQPKKREDDIWPSSLP